jgi:Protein of unknown function (DUF3618)
MTGHNGVVKTDPAAIEADIRRQRQELAHTVDALTAKLDVKARAEAKAGEVLDAMTTDTGRPRPAVIAAAVATVSGVVLLVWWRARS